MTMAVGCLRRQDPETRLFASSANVSKPEVGLPSCLSLILIFVKPTSSQPASQPAAQITRSPPKPKPCGLGFRPGCSCALRVGVGDRNSPSARPPTRTHTQCVSCPCRPGNLVCGLGLVELRPQNQSLPSSSESESHHRRLKLPPAASPRLLANNASKWPPPASDHVHVHPCPCPSLGASQ